MKITSKETMSAAVNQLRDRVRDLSLADSKFNEEYYLALWLKRNGFHMDRTEMAIRESLEWRKTKYPEIFTKKSTDDGFDLGFDSIQAQSDPDDVSITAYPASVTKQGQPVVILKGDGADFRALINKYGKDQVLRDLVKLFATMEQVISGHYGGKGVTSQNTDLNNIGLFIVGSFSDFSFWDAASLDVIQVLLESAKISTRYFPCLATTVYVLNINKFAAIIFRMMKPIISSQSYTVECFDSNKSKWASALLPFIDPEQLKPHIDISIDTQEDSN